MEKVATVITGSTVVTLPRSGHPAKMTARTQRRMLNEVKKNPRVSANGNLTEISGTC